VCKELEFPLQAQTRELTEAEIERQFQAEREWYRLEEERIWQECQTLKREFYRPRGILGWLGYRTSVPGL